MNSTTTVTKLLGVSRRTLMRWVSQYDMELEKNELGHYQFSEDDIKKIRQIQQQTLHQTPQQPDTLDNIRKGSIKRMTTTIDTTKFNEINNRIDELERRVRNKADDVVSYQVLQHRREMEELTSTIQKLEQRIDELENGQKREAPAKDHLLVFDSISAPKKSRKKNLISSIFGF
ncbi:chromosome-anchoring protein RacA [Metabacillus crassostreae]|uniref:MerR family transcriptional regulator n=1 Tax=Metabacillus crassostreae TaxID=929098 RepID=UPI00195B6907|nr:MerR family transcriptional regulator [Metabacillus crassostreae]MBM7605304.1 chromosome-anchoring protein RacA [Metabacillus crassostreae]